MLVEKYVLLYEVEEEALKTIIPEGFLLRKPVLKMTAEIYDSQDTYLEINAAAIKEETAGWLNIASWNGLRFTREGKETIFSLPFLDAAFTGKGIYGPVPYDEESAGCFSAGKNPKLKPEERIEGEREMCDCSFEWKMADGIAAIPCAGNIESYYVAFERHNKNAGNALQQFAKLMQQGGNI